MPRMARLVVPGFPHHVTQRGGRGQSTFFEESDYLTYVEILQALKQSARVEVLAYCLMPNHIHAIVVPGDTQGLARLFGTAHHRYARYINNRHGWQGHLWQERFHSFVMDENHLLAAVRYVELNPVRAGLCGRAEDWCWSSVHAHLGIAVDDLVSPSPVLEQISDWYAYLGQTVNNDLFDDLREHTRTGRPAGDEEFLKRLEEMTGRRVRRRKPGRKPSRGSR